MQLLKLRTHFSAIPYLFLPKKPKLPRFHCPETFGENYKISFSLQNKLRGLAL